MNVNRLLRPALRTVTAGLVTAVAVTTLAAPSATIAGKEGLKNNHPTVSAGKEGLKNRVKDADVTVAGKEGLKKRVAARDTATAEDLDLVGVSVYPAMSTTAYEAQVVAAVNAVRKQHGLRALTLQSCTDRYAEGWAAKLASTGAFYHRSMTTILRGCHARYAGETLGRGQISAETLVSMWMNSAPHRAVLMSPKPTRIGVGSVPNSKGQWVTAANFTRF